MKITERRLRQIIRSVIKENLKLSPVYTKKDSFGRTDQALFSNYKEVIDKYVKRKYSTDRESRRECTLENFLKDFGINTSRLEASDHSKLVNAFRDSLKTYSEQKPYGLYHHDVVPNFDLILDRYTEYVMSGGKDSAEEWMDKNCDYDIKSDPSRDLILKQLKVIDLEN